MEARLIESQYTGPKRGPPNGLLFEALGPLLVPKTRSPGAKNKRAEEGFTMDLLSVLCKPERFPSRKRPQANPPTSTPPAQSLQLRLTLRVRTRQREHVHGTGLTRCSLKHYTTQWYNASLYVCGVDPAMKPELRHKRLRPAQHGLSRRGGRIEDAANA